MPRKEKMKIYHGINAPHYVNGEPDVLINFNNGFYGKGIKKVVDVRNGNADSMTIKPGITGMCGEFTKSTTSNSFLYYLTLEKEYDMAKDLSISAIIKTEDIQAYFSGFYFMSVTDTSNPISPKAIYRFLSFDDSLEKGKDIISFAPYNTSGSVITTVFFDIPSEYVFFQTIIKNLVAYYYINGELKATLDLNSLSLLTTKFNTIQVLFPNNVIGKVNVEQLAITQGIEQPYNPIPRDYSEGKAIIKERLGQQQIKGDPLISQETSVILPAYIGDKKSRYIINPDGSGNLKSNPEVINVWDGAIWGSGAKFTIKALSKEIISGVIDTDTALCRTLNNVSYAQNTNFDVKVSTTSGIAVGDTLKIVYDKGNIFTTPDDNLIVVNVVDANTLTLKCTNMVGSINSIDYFAYLVESTTTSSSPIVKTTDGTTVVGTWTGLGTNEATFTLGTNSGLTGKDLVVTYSLNIPQNNSHFPELPHTIERAYTETGEVLVKSNEILITEDFVGKELGSTKLTCSTVKQGGGFALVDPNIDSFSELSTERYGQISKLDGVTRDYSAGTTNGSMPQFLLTFNLIDIVERKIGTIPGDKIAWVNANVNLSIDVHAMGNSPDGYYAQLNIYKKGSGWVDSIYNSTNSIQRLAWSNVISDGRVSDTGNVYFLLSSKPANGTFGSIVQLDYVKLYIRLKMDSAYEYFYTTNFDSKSSKCNPVLVQKESKTIKRYIPSKECFVTESLTYNKSMTQSSTSEVACDKGLLKLPYIYLTNYGTGNLVDSSYTLGLPPLVPRLPLNPKYKPYQFTLGNIPLRSLEGLPSTHKDRVFLAKVNSVIDGLPNSTNQNKFYSEGKIRDVGEQLLDSYPFALRLGAGLVVKNGEIYMKVRSCVPNSVNYSKSNILSMSTDFDMDSLYKLPNRPLIK